jgi:hypothetical protein
VFPSVKITFSMQILIESLPSESSSTELQLTSVGQLEEDGKLASEELDRQVHMFNTLNSQDYANILLYLRIILEQPGS